MVSGPGDETNAWWRPLSLAVWTQNSNARSQEAFDRREKKHLLRIQSWAKEVIGSTKRRTAVAEQLNRPAYISHGQGKALGEDIEASLKFGEDIVEQRLHSFRHGSKEGMHMMQSNWKEQRQSHQNDWYAKEYWGEEKWEDRQWEDRQWGEETWSQRDDPQWD